MNANCYKTIFSKRLGCLVAVGEHAIGQGKASGAGGPGFMGAVAAVFGLHVVQRAVQDEAHNRTRFVVVTRPERQPPSVPTGHDCTSLIVSVHNRPGAMHDLLVPLKKHGVSMTRFESRPARSGQWDYIFYIDVAGHPQEPAVAAALDELRAQSSMFKVLGSFPLDPH